VQDSVEEGELRSEIDNDDNDQSMTMEEEIKED